MGVMSVRLNDEILTRLYTLAKLTGRSHSCLARKAIEDFIDCEAKQIVDFELACQAQKEDLDDLPQLNR
jgi:predicted transcriptional regulator